MKPNIEGGDSSIVLLLAIMTFKWESLRKIKHKTIIYGAISSFIKSFRVKERPVSETSDVIVCQDTLHFPKIFLWTENEPIQNPEH